MDSMNCNTTALSRPTVLRRSINFSQDFLEDLEAIQLVKRMKAQGSKNRGHGTIPPCQRQ